MSDEIKVKVTKHAGRKYLIMYYDDPITGKRVQESTKETDRDKANKKAGAWEDKLLEGRYKPPSKITWKEFRERYENEVLAGLADKTDKTVGTVFNTLERIISPRRLRDLSAARLSHYQAELRKGRSPATVKTYLAHLRAALKWAVEQGLMPSVPKIAMPKRAKQQKEMKGRPITLEEFERMLSAVPKGLFNPPKKPNASAVANTDNKPKRRFKTPPRPEIPANVKAEIVASWRHLLRGLWLSGLRLGEALDLWWDREDKIMVDFSGRRPMLRIRAELEKANQNRRLPMTPDFAEFLLATLDDDRSGPVFRPIGLTGTGECRDPDWVSKIVSRIGRAAGVKVNTDASGKVKFASAHDLRRSFGDRWARRVMPQVLMELMRHESMDTTLRYYVGRNAEATADAVWEAVGTPGGVGTFVGTA